MIDGAAAARDAVLVAVALLGGYLVGSMPTARLAGRESGRGWNLLALTADLAKGVLPVAVGIVTWSWAVGWAGGLGAVVGARWPWFGRRHGGSGVATLAGAAFTLAPPVAMISLLLAVGVLAAGRLARRDTMMLAGVVGFGTFPALFQAVHQDLARLGAVLALYLVVLVRSPTTQARQGRDDRP